jgi:hypothetical protein
MIPITQYQRTLSRMGAVSEHSTSLEDLEVATTWPCVRDQVATRDNGILTENHV